VYDVVVKQFTFAISSPDEQIYDAAARCFYTRSIFTAQLILRGRREGEGGGRGGVKIKIVRSAKICNKI